MLFLDIVLQSFTPLHVRTLRVPGDAVSTGSVVWWGNGLPLDGVSRKKKHVKTDEGNDVQVKIRPH